ncbi:sensor histidine kinase [Nocardia brevicatena]|uniref:sensor histidine kinase n=1 Tax=Nocardia brevicatena TaxID=37327 RepID=UPI000592D227|nr:nitrate- and nitrite sensing domain-containing protein [Nocardia brevicatena]
MLRVRLGVRTRILTIALIPSLTLLVAGVGGAGYLIDEARHDREFTEAAQTGIEPTRVLLEAVQQERRLTLAHLAGDAEATAALPGARAHTDRSMQQLANETQALVELEPNVLKRNVGDFAALYLQREVIRTNADNRTLPAADAYTFYSRLLDVITVGTQIAVRLSLDTEVAVELGLSGRHINVIEALSRSNALTGAALTAHRPVTLPEDYRQQTGHYRSEMSKLAGDFGPPFRERAQALVASPAWKQLATMENALFERSVNRPDEAASPPLPMDADEWEAASAQVEHELLELWDDHNTATQRLAHDAATRAATRSLLIGLSVLLLSAAAFAVSLVLANRFIRRLERLRDQTLALADERLPDMLERLRAGEQITPEEQAPRLDFGHDEIGSVATAFEHAHAVAINAAITEARTQEGVKAVFRSIAHRSQMVVHRQLEILDEAESREEDPALLETLFRLDHLATRERRNAENLIIMAGGRPGRQWRNPVPLVDLVRSAIGETLDYARVQMARLPDLRIAGNAVGDLIHLLAELMDNASSFSPPKSQVHVSASVVGKGVAIEITDQGMGMAAEDLERVNETLRKPPDFGIAAFSADSRLGIFVVAHLSARHGITARLGESDYGGIRAVVHVPGTLLTDPADEPTEVGALPVIPPPRTAATNAAAATQMVNNHAGAATLLAEPLPAPATSSTPNGSHPADEHDVPTDRHVALPATTSESEPELLPDGRPALPRRSRQANVAPRPANSEDAAPHQPPAAQPRSPEEARAVMAAIDMGTRQGRRALPDNGSGTVTPPPVGMSPDEQEG